MVTSILWVASVLLLGTGMAAVLRIRSEARIRARAVARLRKSLQK